MYAVTVIKYLNELIFTKLAILEYRIENLEEKYKPFERVDRNNWKIYEIYFCAVFLLPIRLFLILISGFFLSCITTINSYFTNKEEQDPEFGRIKRSFFKVMYRAGAKIWIFCLGCYWINKKQYKIKDFDETYPQENYINRKELQNPPILVCNHLGLFETVLMISTRFVPSLISKAEIQKIPIIGNAIQGIQSIFVDRADRKNKDGVLSKIISRCQNISQGRNFPPILLFPEGTTSNGQYLLNFKRGAFAPLVPIKIFDHLGLESQDDWEIYAQKILDIMSKALDLIPSNSGYRQAVEYRKLLVEYQENQTKKSKSENYKDIECLIQTDEKLCLNTPYCNYQGVSDLGNEQIQEQTKINYGTVQDDGQ